MGVMEHVRSRFLFVRPCGLICNQWGFRLHPMLRYPQEYGDAHLESEIGRSGYVDARANGGEYLHTNKGRVGLT
jgi:hypothetical protein